MAKKVEWPTEKSLSLQQAKLIKAYLDPVNKGSKTEAAKIAGYKCAGSNLGSIFGSKPVQKALQTALERAGLTEDQLANALAELVQGQELENGKPKKINIFGKDKAMAEYIPPVDFQARGKGLDIVFKLRGEYAPVKIETNDCELTMRLEAARRRAIEAKSPIVDAEFKEADSGER